MPAFEASGVATIDAIHLPGQMAQMGLRDRGGGQPVNIGQGNPNQLWMGDAPGTAQGLWSFAVVMTLAEAAAVIAALIGTTPITCAVGYTGGSATGTSITGICADFDWSVQQGSPMSICSGTIRHWDAPVSGGTPSALSLTADDLVNGVDLATVGATLLAGDHLAVTSQSVRMRREFNEYARDPSTGYALIHSVKSTRYEATVEYAADGTSELAQWTPICPVPGTIILTFPGSCGATPVTCTLSIMKYDDAPSEGAQNGVVTERVTAISALPTSTLVAA